MEENAIVELEFRFGANPDLLDRSSASRHPRDHPSYGELSGRDLRMRSVRTAYHGLIHAKPRTQPGLFCRDGQLTFRLCYAFASAGIRLEIAPCLPDGARFGEADSLC